MPRICITFHQEIVNELKIKAKYKQISVSQYIRELITMGLKLEEMAAQKDNFGNGKNNETNIPDESKLLWKNILRWELESLYLTRCLTNDLLPKMSEEYLSTAKQKAEAFVDGLLIQLIPN